MKTRTLSIIFLHRYHSPQRLRTSWKTMYLKNISCPSILSKSISQKQTSMKQYKNSTQKISIPKTSAECSVAITSPFGAGISIANLLGVYHLPKWDGLIIKKNISRKLLINSDVEGMSRTIRSSYYKTSLANFLSQTGRCASGVLIIKPV